MTYSRQELAALGKRASDLHRIQGVDLTQAVVKVASTERGLTDEHLTRITENANLITFEEKFKSGDTKHVVFDLADPAEVVQGMAEPESHVSSLYDFPPDYGHEEDIFDQFEEKISAFNQNYDFIEHQNMLKVAHACQLMESDVHRLDSEAERALYALTDMVKKAALQHGSLYGPLQVIGAVANDHDLFEKVAHVTVTMLPNIPRGEYVDMAPNFNHPLAAQYLRVEDLTKEASRYKNGLRTLVAERDRMRSTRRMMEDL